MKRNFMPSIDGLYKMQRAGLDVYSYLVTKAVEALTMNGIVLYRKGILNKDGVYKYILSDPELVLPICRMYPSLIPNIKIAYDDIDLLNILLDTKINSCPSSLDNLAYFEKGTGVLTNNLLIKKIILQLSSELRENPKYRFEYKDNSCLYKIFSTDILSNLYMDLTDEEIKSLMEIEPYYGILLDGIEPNEINKAMQKYFDRYNIDTSNGEKYKDKDILTNRDIKVKRLIKTINENNI